MSKLSDDDSSSDSSNEFLVPADKLDLDSKFFKQPAKKANPKKTKVIKKVSSDDSDDEFDEVDQNNVSSAELLAQVLKNLENTKKKFGIDNNHSDVSTSKATEKESADTKKNDNDLSKEINDLLQQGESSKTLSKQDNDDEQGNEEESKPEIKTEYNIPEKGVQIHLPGENVMFDKKKKKQQDLQRMLQNKINSRIRSSQLLVHKVGLLCWLAHGFYLNKLANDPDLLGVALSLVDPHNYPKNKADLKYLQRFTKWFSGMFKICEEHKEVVFHKEILLQRISGKKVYNYVELILLFVATLRGMGINCRLVISLQPPPRKPRPEQLMKLPTNEEKDKNSKSIKKEIKEEDDDSDFEEITNKEDKKVTPQTDGKSKANKGKSKAKRKSISPVKEPANTKEAVQNANLEAKKRAAAILKGKITANSSKNKSTEMKKNQNVKKEEPKKTKNDKNDEQTDEEDEDNTSIARKLRSRIKKDEKPKTTKKTTNKNKKDGKNKTKTTKSNSKTKNSGSSSDEFEIDSENDIDSEDEVSEDAINSEDVTDFSTDEEYVEKKPKKKTLKKPNSKTNNRRQSIANKSANRSNKQQKVLSSDDDDKKIFKNSYNVWAEVYLESEESWICVSVMDQKVNCVSEIYKKAGDPVLYVVAWNSIGTLKDVTRRYCPHWLTDTRKKRIDEKWWQATLSNWKEKKTAMSKAEDEQLLQKELEQPLPKTVSECKGHPLYVLQRHLLKFEALYPPDAAPLGHLKTGEAIYSRYCVHTLYSRETWVKRARVVKPAQEAYKIVKAMPKYDKLSGQKIRDQPLELFGKWQTNPYEPPEAKDGKVPRNEYGNVDLFKMCMLPKGTVYINLPALNRVARKLNIDCAPACVGFNFGCRGALPAFEGYVVCAEFEDQLRDAWENDQIEAQKRATEKREKRIYGNWKKLIKGLLIRRKLASKYKFGGKDEDSNGEEEIVYKDKSPVKKRRSVKTKVVEVKKRKSAAKSKYEDKEEEEEDEYSESDSDDEEEVVYDDDDDDEDEFENEDEDDIYDDEPPVKKRRTAKAKVEVKKTAPRATPTRASKRNKQESGNTNSKKRTKR